MDNFFGTFPVWGDDPYTLDIVEGALPSSQITLQLVNSNVLYDIILPEITFNAGLQKVFETADFQMVDYGNDLGCTDSLAINFDPYVEVDDNSCIYPIYGCVDPNVLIFSPTANINQISSS